MRNVAVFTAAAVRFQRKEKPMDDLKIQVNSLLKEVYWNIHAVQEDFVRRVGRADISMGEMHILEVVGDAMTVQSPDSELHSDIAKGCRISDIAAKMRITLPSVTVAINKLIGKNCVKKVRCADDARCVHVILTDFGIEVYCRHQNFHNRMVEEVIQMLSESERAVMLKCFSCLNTFFKEKIIRESK